MLLQVFRDCDSSQVEGWVSTLEEQSQITPLWEVFFQLMCHPVPQVQHPALVPAGSFQPFHCVSTH